jgi:hypothetical protein
MAIWRDLLSPSLFVITGFLSFVGGTIIHIFDGVIFSYLFSAFQSLLGSGRGEEGELHVRKAFSFRKTSGFFDEDQWMQMGLVFHLSGQRRFSVIPLTYIFL